MTPAAREELEVIVAAIMVHAADLHYLAALDDDPTYAAVIRAAADALFSEAEKLHRTSQSARSMISHPSR